MLVDPSLGEDVAVTGELRQPGPEVRRDELDVVLDRLPFTLALHDQLGEVLVEDVSDHLDHQVGLGVQQFGGATGFSFALDDFPLRLQSADIGADLFFRGTLCGSPDDHTGALRDHVFQDVFQPGALVFRQLAADPGHRALRHVDQIATRQADLTRQPGPFVPDRVFADLDQDLLARLERLLDFAAAARHAVPVDLAGVEHGVSAFADVDKGCLHAGQHVLHPAEIDVAGVRRRTGLRDVVLDQDAVFEHGNLRAVALLANNHLPIDGLAAGQELGLGEDGSALATGVAALLTADPFRRHPGGAADAAYPVLVGGAAAVPGAGALAGLTDAGTVTGGLIPHMNDRGHIVGLVRTRTATGGAAATATAGAGGDSLGTVLVLVGCLGRLVVPGPLLVGVGGLDGVTLGATTPAAATSAAAARAVVLAVTVAWAVSSLTLGQLGGRLTLDAGRVFDPHQLSWRGSAGGASSTASPGSGSTVFGLVDHRGGRDCLAGASRCGGGLGSLEGHDHRGGAAATTGRRGLVFLTGGSGEQTRAARGTSVTGYLGARVGGWLGGCCLEDSVGNGRHFLLFERGVHRRGNRLDRYGLGGSLTGGGLLGRRLLDGLFGCGRTVSGGVSAGALGGHALSRHSLSRQSLSRSRSCGGFRGPASPDGLGDLRGRHCLGGGVVHGIVGGLDVEHGAPVRSPRDAAATTSGVCPRRPGRQARVRSLEVRSARGRRANDFVDLSRCPGGRAGSAGGDAVGCERIVDLATGCEQTLRETRGRGRHRCREFAHRTESGEDVVGSYGRRHVLHDHIEYRTVVTLRCRNGHDRGAGVEHAEAIFRHAFDLYRVRCDKQRHCRRQLRYADSRQPHRPAAGLHPLGQ